MNILEIEEKYICIFNQEKLDFKYNLNKLMELCEHAHWYYLDVLVDKFNLEKVNFYTFLYNMFINKKMDHCVNNIKYYNSIYNKYKKTIPTAGCLLCNESSLLLVRVRNGTKFGLPKGKKTGFETIFETAVRETKEETGLDVSYMISNKKKYIEILRTKLYKINLPSQDIDLTKYDKKEIEEVRWFEKKYIEKHKDEFTNQVKIAIKLI